MMAMRMGRRCLERRAFNRDRGVAPSLCFSIGFIRKPVPTFRSDALAAAGLALLCWSAVEAMPLAQAAENTSPRISPKQLRRDVDVSPLPNYKGDYVSAGLDGEWRKPGNAPQFIGAATAAPGEPPADCSRESIIHYASLAPGVFEKDKKGLLYGVETHTTATRVKNVPGFYSCALVVYAILKRAGCDWVKYTPDAKAIYDMVAAKGWRKAPRQEGGCIVAWNSRTAGNRGRIARDRSPGGGVLFRHVGITTGGWMSVDNTSFLSRPQEFFTWRPWRYEWPIFLCPPAAPEKKAE
jgi:hypothetical protein